MHNMRESIEFAYLALTLLVSAHEGYQVRIHNVSAAQTNDMDAHWTIRCKGPFNINTGMHQHQR